MERAMEFRSSFSLLSREEQLKFLRFNAYHFRRPFSEVLQIYVQDPEATQIGDMNYWKTQADGYAGLADEKAIQIVQGKEVINLFDIRQTILKRVPQIEEGSISDALFYNLLEDMTGEELSLEIPQANQFLEDCKAAIQRFLTPYLGQLKQHQLSQEEEPLTFELVRYNIFEQFGIFAEENGEVYDALEASLLDQMTTLKDPERLTLIFSVADNLSKGVIFNVEQNYKQVETRIQELKATGVKLQSDLIAEDVAIDFNSSVNLNPNIEVKKEIQDLSRFKSWVQRRLLDLETPVNGFELEYFDIALGKEFHKNNESYREGEFSEIPQALNSLQKAKINLLAEQAYEAGLTWNDVLKFEEELTSQELEVVNPNINLNTNTNTEIVEEKKEETLLDIVDIGRAKENRLERQAAARARTNQKAGLLLSDLSKEESKDILFPSSKLLNVVAFIEQDGIKRQPLEAGALLGLSDAAIAHLLKAVILQANTTAKQRQAHSEEAEQEFQVIAHNFSRIKEYFEDRGLELQEFSTFVWSNTIHWENTLFFKQLDEIENGFTFLGPVFNPEVSSEKNTTVSEIFSDKLQHLEEIASSRGYYLWTRNEKWTDDPEDDEGIQFLFDEGLYEAHAYDFKTIEELDDWLDNEEVFIVDGLGNRTTFVELDQFMQLEKQKLRDFESGMSDGLYDFVSRDSDMFEKLMPEPFGNIVVDASSNQDKITAYRVDTETDEHYKWFEMEKSTGIILSQDSSIAKMPDAQMSDFFKYLKVEYDKKILLNAEHQSLSMGTQREERNIDKIRIEWNETLSQESYHFLNQSHEGEVITEALLQSMIQDEVQLENQSEIGYYKVKTTLDRIDIGDGFESNQSLYEEIAKENGLEVDVEAYYRSIVPSKDQKLSIEATLQAVRDKMNLSEDVKVKPAGAGSFSLMKESFGGALNEPVVEWYPGGKPEVKDAAEQLTGVPLFEQQFYEALAEIITEEISEIPKVEKQVTEDLVQKTPSLDYELEEVRQKILIETVAVLKLPSSEFQIQKQNNKTVSLVRTGLHSIVAPLVTLRATGEAEFNSINLKAALKKYPSLSTVQETFEKVKENILQLEKGESEQVKVPTTDDASLLEQFPNAEERDELDPMEDFMVMLMSGEDELTIIVDDKDVYHHKISDSKDGQQIIFEMRQDKSTDTRYLVYENGKFIKNTFGDDIPDSRLINPIALEDLEQRLEENKLKLQNQTEVSQQVKEISLFDSFDAEKETSDVSDTITTTAKGNNLSSNMNFNPNLNPNIELEVTGQEEIHALLHDFNFPDTEKFYPQTPTQKVIANITALKLLKELETTGRKATPSQQKVLAKYVGWGGLANTFFDASNPRFKEYREELQTLVSESEYRALRESSLTAYYTSPDLIKEIYDFLEKDLNFTGTRILDPSMGTGNFFSAMPESLQERTERYGVELDSLSGRLANQLQQSSNIQVKGFEHTKFSNDVIDLVITNVPFGQIPIYDSSYSSSYMIHDYFIKKSLDLVHDGGLVAVLTSTGTLDKKDSRFREELSKVANLVTAVRLPDNAFKDIAGTDVTSDLLIFQKVAYPEVEPEWIQTIPRRDDMGNQVSYNLYFEQHPEQVLGDIKIKRFNGGTLSVKANYESEDLKHELAIALKNSVNTKEVSYFVEKREDRILEEAEILDIALPQEIYEKTEPFTIQTHEGRAYYHFGSERGIEELRKVSSVTLNVNETRERQLKRYENNRTEVFEEKEQFKSSATLKGVFDGDGDFIEKSGNKTSLVHYLDSKYIQDLYENSSLEKNGYRFTYDRKAKEIRVEEKVGTQYFYHYDYTAKEIKAMSQMVEIRQTLQSLLEVQHEVISDNDEKYQLYRQRLNNQYDDFVSEFGAINSRSNRVLFKRDDFYPFLCSIEDEVENPESKETHFEKGRVFFEPTINPSPQAVEVDNEQDALLASLNHKGLLNFEYMLDIYPGVNKVQLIEELGDRIFYIGEGEYETREDYLSGDVKSKLEEVKLRQEMGNEGRDWSIQIAALTKVLPPDLPLEDINYQLGTRFIPNSLYAAFFEEIFEQTEEVEIEFDNTSNSYQVTLPEGWKDAAYRDYGFSYYNGERLATTLLNLKEPKVMMPDPDNPEKRVVDKEKTAEMIEKGERLRDSFKEWTLKNPQAHQDIVRIYNEQFNRHVAKVYDGSHLTVQGLAKQFQLRPHQQNGIMRIVQENRGLLAHEVGSGKTLTMLAAGAKLKELGKKNKPLYVVPKPLIDQFGREIYKYFPESHVLVARSDDFKKENRKEFLSRIANGSYDAVVIADSQFEKVAMSPEYQRHYIVNERDRLEALLSDAIKSGKKYTIKRIEHSLKALEIRLEKLTKKDIDTFIDFESLGVDMLFVDEAHGYKNLAPETQLENVKGVASTRSQKALDMMMKTEYMQEKFNGGGVVFSTGTPLSNSVTELYTMTAFVAPDVLEAHGIRHFDAWVSTFGNIESVFELTASNQYRIKRRFTRFGNMPELMTLFRSFADIQTQEMLDLPVPQHVTQEHVTEVTSEQADYIDHLVDRADKIEGGLVEPWKDNMLKIVSENKKSTLDMRMLDSNKYGAEASHKIQSVTDIVYDIWAKSKEERSTQMIFSDMGVPLKYKNSKTYNPDGTLNDFSVYDEVKKQLIERGVPAGEIAFIHEATDATKEDMMKAMRKGDIRILMGSTQKAGTGLNIQDKLIAVHHLDLPWRYSDIAQRNGRIIRQGNENKEVQIHHYITKGSMDAFLWQTIENKMRFTNQVMSGKSTAREMEELDNESMNVSKYKGLATGDPRKSEFMTLSMELKRLESSRQRFYSGKTNDEKILQEAKQALPIQQKRLEGIKQDVVQGEVSKDYPFEITVSYKGDSKIFTEEDDRKEAGSLLNKCILQNVSVQEKLMKIGEYRGFDLLNHSSTQPRILSENEEVYGTVILRGEADYKVSLNLKAGRGSLIRLDNKIDDLYNDRDITEREITRLEGTIKGIESKRESVYPKEEIYQETRSRYHELREELEGKPLQEDTAAMEHTKESPRMSGMHR